MPYAPMPSSARSNGSVQPSDLPWRTFDLSTSKKWKHCQNKNSPTSTSPSLKFNSPLRPSAQTAPVKNKTAISVSSSESRLSSCALLPVLPFFFCRGNMPIRQKIAGRPSTSVMLVTLLTSEFVITSAPEPPVRPMMNVKIRLPMPVQYGMTSVPSTVPSKPLALKTSSRQTITNDATRNSARNSHGAEGPLATIQWMNGLATREG